MSDTFERAVRNLIYSAFADGRDDAGIPDDSVAMKYAQTHNKRVAAELRAALLAEPEVARKLIVAQAVDDLLATMPDTPWANAIREAMNEPTRIPSAVHEVVRLLNESATAKEPAK